MRLKPLLPLHKSSAPTTSGEPKSNHPPKHHASGPRITNRWRNELVAALAEFAGTFMFLFFAFGATSVANTAATYSDRASAGQVDGSITQAPNTSVLLYISLAFGFSLMVNVWVFFRVSGGLFNPAVCISKLVKSQYRQNVDSETGHTRPLSHRCHLRSPSRAVLCLANDGRHSGYHSQIMLNYH